MVFIHDDFYLGDTGISENLFHVCAVTTGHIHRDNLDILVVVHHGPYCFDDGLFFVIRRHLKEYTGLTVYKHAAGSIDDVLLINAEDAWSNYGSSCCFKLGSIGFKDV